MKKIVLKIADTIFSFKGYDPMVLVWARKGVLGRRHVGGEVGYRQIWGR